jgi:hypothetical protein
MFFLDRLVFHLLHSRSPMLCEEAGGGKLFAGIGTEARKKGQPQATPSSAIT